VSGRWGLDQFLTTQEKKYQRLEERFSYSSKKLTHQAHFKNLLIKNRLQEKVRPNKGELLQGADWKTIGLGRTKTNSKKTRIVRGRRFLPVKEKGENRKERSAPSMRGEKGVAVKGGGEFQIASPGEKGKKRAGGQSGPHSLKKMEGAGQRGGAMIHVPWSVRGRETKKREISGEDLGGGKNAAG